MTTIKSQRPHQRVSSPQQKLARRGAILDAALRLLTAGRLLSINGIAREVGLAKGTLYLYFDTPAELYLALLERALEEGGDLPSVLKGVGMLEGATPQERRRARELLTRAEEVLAARSPRPSPFPHVEAVLGRALLGQALGEK